MEFPDWVQVKEKHYRWPNKGVPHANGQPFTYYRNNCLFVKSVQSALSDLKRPPERLQSQCNYPPFIT